MNKLQFQDLMDALNNKFYNIDKFHIIECYAATHFTIGQIRLILSSLSTRDFRYRALLVLIEYLPTVDVQDAIHIVNTVCECESQYEIRLRTVKLLLDSCKLDEELKETLLYEVTRSVDGNINFVFDLAVSGVEASRKESLTDSSRSTGTSVGLGAEERHVQFLQARQNYLINNRIYPMGIDSSQIEQSPSCSSTNSKFHSKCIIL